MAQKGGYDLPDFFMVRKHPGSSKEPRSSFGIKHSSHGARNAMPDHFNRAIARKRMQDNLSMAFGSSPRRAIRIEMEDHFSISSSKRNREDSPDHFGARTKTNSRLTKEKDHFSVRTKNQKRPETSDHFSAVGHHKKHGELTDHYATVVRKKAMLDSRDHFGYRRAGIERGEDDLYGKRYTRIYLRKNFTGERKRFINRDPNQRKGNLKRGLRQKLGMDPFGVKRRRAKQPQLPKGQQGLFEGGVLPKMSELD